MTFFQHWVTPFLRHFDLGTCNRHKPTLYPTINSSIQQTGIWMEFGWNTGEKQIPLTSSNRLMGRAGGKGWL
jgi:hypothetical protein